MSQQAGRSKHPGTAPRVAVVQDGARLHYVVPLALHRRGMLERVFCDWFSRPGSVMRAGARVARAIQPALGTRMLDRWEPGLAGARVISNPGLAVKILRARQRSGLTYASETQIAAQLAAWVRRRGLGKANAVFGFIRQVDPWFFEFAGPQTDNAPCRLDKDSP